LQKQVIFQSRGNERRGEGGFTCGDEAASRLHPDRLLLFENVAVEHPNEKTPSSSKGIDMV
jgi:hypothetical protein